MARADRDAAFMAFAQEAEGQLMRTAWLLTGPGETAAEAVHTALAVTYVAWPTVRSAGALAHTRRLVATDHVDAWSSTGGSDETHRWLAQLPDDQRRVVVLRGYDDLSEHDTAETLDTSVAAVTSLWSEALAALRELAVADRAHLGGFTRPTATTPPPEQPVPPAPGTLTSGEHEAPGDLHRRLEAALPAHQLPLDLDAARRRGTTTVRRRRLGQALVAAVVVAALAAGAGVLGRARATSTAPPAPSAEATKVSVVPGPATIHAGGFGGDDRTYRVTLRAGAGGSSTVDVTDASGGSTSSLVSLGPVPGPLGRRVTWARVGTTSTVVGIIPSATAQDTVEVKTDRDYGGYSIEVRSIPGTDWSAFTVTFQQPLRGKAPVTDVRWYDHAGRPVGKDGRVGASASVDGRTVWVTADGKEMGVLGHVSTRAQGTLPYLLAGEGRHRDPFRRAGAAPSYGTPRRQAQRRPRVLRDAGDEPAHPDPVLVGRCAGHSSRRAAVSPGVCRWVTARSRGDQLATFGQPRSVGRV